MFKDRFYREGMAAVRFSSVRVAVGESDLWIGWGDADAAGRDGRGAAGRSAEAEVERFALRELTRVRGELADYGAARAGFFDSLEPLDRDLAAPPIAAAMLRAGEAAGVGPMAAVAGAIAEAVGKAVRATFGLAEIVVENGGDLWIDVRSPLVVSVYAGLSSLSRTFGVIVEPSLCPCGLACSSGTVGPSLSFGKADAAIVLCPDAAAADAWATSLGNRIRFTADLEPSVRSLVAPPAGAAAAPENREDSGANLRPLAALAVMADRLAAAGKIRLAPLAPLRRGPASGSIGE